MNVQHVGVNYIINYLEFQRNMTIFKPVENENKLNINNYEEFSPTNYS